MTTGQLNSICQNITLFIKRCCNPACYMGWSPYKDLCPVVNKSLLA